MWTNKIYFKDSFTAKVHKNSLIIRYVFRCFLKTSNELMLYISALVNFSKKYIIRNAALF